MLTIVTTVTKQRFEKYGVSFHEDWNVKYLSGASQSELAEACKDADVLFVGSTDVVSAEVINANPQLKLIQAEGVAFDKIDVEAAKAAGIPVSNNRAVNNVSVAEHTIGLILAGLRRTALCTSEIASKPYTQVQGEYRAQGEHELGGMTVGLVGFGAIGREVAKRLQGWDCNLVYYDAYPPSKEVEEQLHVTYMEQDELFRKADVISLHVPVLPTTTGMINKETMATMKKNVLIVNTARGEIINQEDLVEALENGDIYGAALDVVYPEPAPDDLPLFHMSEAGRSRLTFTPHVGGTTDEAFTRMLRWTVENCERVEKGEKPINSVY